MSLIRFGVMAMSVSLAFTAPAFCQDSSRMPKPGAAAPAGTRGNPDQFFRMLSKGKDSISRAEVSPDLQYLFDKFAQKAGVTDGRITIEQFRRVYNDGKSEGAGMRKAAPKDEAKDVVAPPNVFRTERRGNGNGTGNGNGHDKLAGVDLATLADNTFRFTDQNRDGVLEYDEMPDDLQETMDTWDDNDNGMIDLEEHRRYYVAKAQQRMAEREENGIATPWSNPERDEMPATVPGRDNQRKPLVYNSKNLPQEVPPWFKELDQNRDAQVSLFEWRQGKDRKVQDFARHDRNDDGFITVEDILRGKGGAPNGGAEPRSARGGFAPERFGNGNGNGNGGDWRFGRMGGDNGGERPRINWYGGGGGGERPNWRPRGGDGGERRNMGRPGGGNRERRNGDGRPGERDK
jgi:hypothetical protein